jgi:hypothetical protein
MATQLGLIVQLTRSRFAPHFHQITVECLNSLLGGTKAPAMKSLIRVKFNSLEQTIINAIPRHAVAAARGEFRR